MRHPDEQSFALECLKLAQNAPRHFSGYGQGLAGYPSSVPHPEPASSIVERAEAYLAFVLGCGADDAKTKLAAVREVVA